MKPISGFLASLPPEEQSGPLATLLPALFFGEKKQALNASYELWNILCNQGQVVPAALPVYDLLVQGLPELEPDLQVEVLDILWRAALRERLQRDRAVYQRLAQSTSEDSSLCPADPGTAIEKGPGASQGLSVLVSDRQLRGRLEQ